MLTKLYLTKPEIAIFPLNNIKNYNGFVIIDCFDNIYKKHINYLPQLFLKNYVFISSNSFQQNHYILSNQIRKYISQLLSPNIIAIGGESYLYGILFCNNIIHYTNSKFIYNDCNYNNKFYRKNIENNLIDYNKDIISDKYNFCLINLSSLPINLCKNINKNLYTKLVIISCNHEDFWKKRKLLSNYRLIKRQKFICWKIGYFITINIFIPIFVSLGGNCSVTYQLQKRNIRNKAYPFDWSKISYKKLLEVLRNNFEGYSNIYISKFSENHENTFIIKNKYNYFAHEVLHIDRLDKFKEKLERRIKRLDKLDNIIFIRIELDNINDYSELVKELDKKFKNYKLIIISKNKITGEKIINYLLPNYINWKYDNFNWDNILYLGEYTGATCGVV